MKTKVKPFVGFIFLVVFLLASHEGVLGKLCEIDNGICNADDDCTYWCGRKGYAVGICWFRGPFPRNCVCRTNC
ncbi:hypothetical protein ABFS83_13G143600 [Erythranthe nasuta]